MRRALAALLLLAACQDPRRAAAEPVARAAAADEDPALHPPTREELARYPWLDPETPIRTLADALPPPAGFHRVAVAQGAFGAWLRTLPLRPSGTPVRSYRGELLRDAADRRIAAVAELDVGGSDLQQC